MSTVDIPIACALSDADLARRRAEIAAGVFAQVEAVEELPDGFAFRFATTNESARELLDFMLYERECCAFLNFELVFERGHGATWLRMRGGEDVKSFVRAAFVPA